MAPTGHGQRTSLLLWEFLDCAILLERYPKDLPEIHIRSAHRRSSQGVYENPRRDGPVSTPLSRGLRNTLCSSGGDAAIVGSRRTGADKCLRSAAEPAWQSQAAHGGAERRPGTPSAEPVCL